MNRIFILFLIPIAVARAQAIDPSTARQSQDPDGEDRRHIGIGFFVGTPSSVGFRGQLAVGPLVVRLSGASWGKAWWGYQAAAGVIVSEAGGLMQSIDMIAGRFANDTKDENGVVQHLREEYLGIAYDVTYAGFFLQLGLAGGRGDYPNPQLAYQVGYMFLL